MSEAILLRQNGQIVNRPGTSCLGCRRRKLKCTREPEGCNNCVKSDLPCVYPTPDVGVKRKRGPYKKDKPARQRHLEDLVKYLEPRATEIDPNGQPGTESSHTVSSPGLRASTDASSSRQGSLQMSTPHPNSEDLVKDALIALTRSSASDNEPRDGVGFLSHGQGAGSQNASSAQHPSTRRILELWHLFVTRVDPMTKILHCPTFGQRLITLIDDLNNVTPSMEALLFSIYFTAVSTCTVKECQIRFGENQASLMKRYGHAVESAISNNYEIPALEALQALVLYTVAIRRKDDGTSVRALFTVAVRSAQLIGLHEDPEGKYSPFENEYRRRLWYHLYGLESRTAEESSTRAASIMQNRDVQLPLNLNDYDIDPAMSEKPGPRDGVTDVTFVLLRFEIHQLVYGLWNIRRRATASTDAPGAIYEEQMKHFERTRSRFDARYLAHMDSSRPYDYMCMLLIDGMLLKAKLIIEFPLGTVPSMSMPAEERARLLQASVDIIRTTHRLATDDRFSDWLWYFRGFVQWNSLGIVVAELNISTNGDFVDSAWKVLDPILVDWDHIYRSKKEEPAWEHVNSLIERARFMRQQRLAIKDRNDKANGEADRLFNPCAVPINAQAIMPIHERQSSYSATQSPTFEAISPMQQPSSIMSQTNQAHLAGIHSTDSCAGSGSLLNFDMNNVPFDNFDDIDFSAFGHVFGSGEYDFLDPYGAMNIQVDGIGRVAAIMSNRNG